MTYFKSNVNFLNVLYVNHCHFAEKRCSQFSAENIAAINFVSTARLNEFSANDFVKQTML